MMLLMLFFLTWKLEVYRTNGTRIYRGGTAVGLPTLTPLHLLFTR